MLNEHGFPQQPQDSEMYDGGKLLRVAIDEPRSLRPQLAGEQSVSEDAPTGASH